MSKPVDANFDDGLVLSGYQKKLNTMKKKFFVLYKDTSREGARLEYFDSIKKFKSGAVPKRVVKLENCFNINRRLDTKHDYVIALATKDGGFGIVLDSEAEMLKWLQALLFLQRSITNKSDIYMQKFEHVWQVNVQKKALAEERRIIGNYHVCLSAKSVTFIRIGPERSSSGYIRTTDINIPLNTIRRCGDSHCLFYMEVGRQCIIGPGELWMETEDPLVAQSMHKMISSAMSARTENIGDSMRKRSSSVTEASKPNSFTDTGNYRADNKNYNMNQSGNSNMARGRCDSFPTRIQESSDILNQSFKSSQIQHIPCSIVPGSLLSRHSTSPPSVSPFGCTEIKETSKLDEQEESGNYLPYRFKSAERAIPEENSDDLINSDSSINFQGETYISMSPLSIDNNKIQKERQIASGDAASLSSVNSQNSLVTTLLSSQMHSIIISSAGPNESENEERPKRSYSIGSRVDKNKNKRLENSNEIAHDTNAVRVRAFSVGSRAKIPKCDLQRAVLYPRSRYNTSCISNNSLNFGADEVGYKLELNANSEKKSTSAPLLVQNSQLPIDCMSDLMEIDFSKSSSHKTHGKLVPANEKCSDNCVNEIKVSHISKSDCDFSQPLPSLPTTDEQSGYLEMKPVNNESFHTINKSSPALCKKNSDKMANMNNIFKESSVTKQEIEKSFQEKCANVAKVSKNQKNRFSLATKRLNPVLLEENGMNRIEMNENSTATVKNSLQSTNDYPKEISLSTGREQKSALPVISETISAASYTPSSSYHPICSTFKSSAISQCKAKQMPQSVVGCEESEGYCIIDNKTQQNNTPISSTASSCYELYYAKLDLPKYSTKDSTKFHKGEADISTRINTENDSYAKIDFDHSSDSSSSSKTLIN
ncbi:insulin receptor substrate 1 isoform X2 [Ceratitis capitata]|nr:insulin receptor substrate 1 isoform X2 [Ceratitis capitata]XP_004519369.1 insulin receptor substrate 1 isoform X2 [Ceratitis capitata]CAD6996954.1 unnamed protein product [Ceratitis capitata]